MSERQVNKERILVCLSASPSNETVIRAGERLAEAFQGRLIALFVETPDYPAAEERDKARLRANMALAESLGGKVETVAGDDVPYQIAEYARQASVTKIVLGRSNTSAALPGHRSLVDRVVELTPELDLYIIPDRTGGPYTPHRVRRVERKQLARDIIFSLGTLALSTTIGFLFHQLGFTDANIIMIYLLGLLAVSAAASYRGTSLVWAVASVLLFDLLFTTPQFSFLAYGTGYPVTFLVMFVAAFFISSMTIRLRAGERQSAKAAGRMRVILDTDKELSKAKTEEEILDVLSIQLIRLLHRSIVVYPERDGELLSSRFYPVGRDVSPYDEERERPAALASFEKNCPAGTSTQLYPEADYLYFCLRVGEKLYGVVGINVKTDPLESSERSVALSVIGECALTIENHQTAREKESADLLAEKERVRADLLRAISHDLRTPLTSILGNADNLMGHGEDFDAETRQGLYAAIYDDSLWLTGIVENLLSASRIEEGEVKLRRTSELVSDIVDEAAEHLGRKLEHYALEIRHADDLLLVSVDARLMVQVVVNLLDNAVKYTPVGSHIWVETFREGDMAHVRVSDDGSGIPDRDKPRLFEKFYTGEGPVADSRRSLGLGLALCKSIVTVHGGTIRAADRPGGGAQFEFTVPVGEVKVRE